VEGDDGDGAVRGRGGEMAAWLWRRPGDEVDGCGVESEFVDALPLSVLFAPDEDATVVGGGCKNRAVLWMSPGDTPDCAIVPKRM